MLVIRLQRTGRKKIAYFRIVVQDSRRTPTSGRIVAQVGHFNPHTKEIKVDKDAVVKYLTYGAKPSDRVIMLLKGQKIELPSWVKEPIKQAKKVRFPQKRRSTRTEEEISTEHKKTTPESSEETPQDEQSIES